MKDPIERWEWEGGAVAADATPATEERPVEAGGRPAETAVQAEPVARPSSSSSERRDVR